MEEDGQSPCLCLIPSTRRNEKSVGLHFSVFDLCPEVSALSSGFSCIICWFSQVGMLRARESVPAIVLLLFSPDTTVGFGHIPWPHSLHLLLHSRVAESSMLHLVALISVSPFLFQELQWTQSLILWPLSQHLPYFLIPNLPHFSHLQIFQCYYLVSQLLLCVAYKVLCWLIVIQFVLTSSTDFKELLSWPHLEILSIIPENLNFLFPFIIHPFELFSVTHNIQYYSNFRCTIVFRCLYTLKSNPHY